MDDLSTIWFEPEADILARYKEGPMSKKEKEKLFADNPKFKEMNEEYGDLLKEDKSADESDESDKQASLEQVWFQQ